MTGPGAPRPFRPANAARWENGDYLPAETIGPGITNLFNVGHPFVAPDGTYLLYDARRPGSGKSLLFISYRLKDGSWSQGMRVFDQDDAREYESCPSVSPDGKFLFFGRDHDICWASAAFIEQRRPNKQFVESINFLLTPGSGCS